MKTTPIYISSLKLSGVKTFSGSTELLMEREDGSISNWTLIFGENGIGKSTLLQCIAWMKPALPYDGIVKNDFEPAPLIDNEENEVLESLVSKSSSKHLTAVIGGSFTANKNLNSKSIAKTETCKTGIVIKLDKHRKLAVVEPIISYENTGIFFKDEVSIYGYSASRVLGKQNITDNRLLDTIPGFINENSELYDIEEILQTLDYARLGKKKGSMEQEKFSNVIDRIKSMLVDILPDIKTKESIEILPPKVLLSDQEGGVIITTKHGKRIPFSDFSLGYKTITSWTVDLAWRMFNKFENSNDPLTEPVIVLIDEIDLHLHPLWQRDIMQNLSKHFPNVQFIATAHSPLMLQAALDYNYAVVSYNEDEKQLNILNRPEDVDGWRVDQILTSNLFGLESARGIKYDDLIKRRKELVGKKSLKKDEKHELSQIDKQLRSLPTGEDPQEMEKRNYIVDLYNKIQRGEIKFE